MKINWWILTGCAFAFFILAHFVSVELGLIPEQITTEYVIGKIILFVIFVYSFRYSLGIVDKPNKAEITIKTTKNGQVISICSDVDTDDSVKLGDITVRINPSK